jgi:hypothetical protein
MDKVKKPSDSECYTPSSEHLRLYTYAAYYAEGTRIKGILAISNHECGPPLSFAIFHPGKGCSVTLKQEIAAPFSVQRFERIYCDHLQGRRNTESHLTEQTEY